VTIWVTIRCAGGGQACAAERAARLMRDFPYEDADEAVGIEEDDGGEEPRAALVHIVLGGAALTAVQWAFLCAEGASYRYWGQARALACRDGGGPGDAGAFANWLALQQDEPGYEWARALFLYAAERLASPAQAIAWFYCLPGSPGAQVPAWWARLAARVEQRQRRGMRLDKGSLQQELEAALDEAPDGRREGCAPAPAGRSEREGLCASHGRTAPDQIKEGEG
jgi:hypothetical protein